MSTPALSPTARRERTLQAFCDRQWQVHERHGRVGLPFHVDRYGFLEAAWPVGRKATEVERKAKPLEEEDLEGSPRSGAWILAALIAFSEKVAPAATGDLQARLEELMGERVPMVQQGWREDYQEELIEFVTLGMYLTNDQFFKGCQWVFERLQLSDPEQEVTRLWMAGYATRLSDGSWHGARHIARHLNRRKELVHLQLESSRQRLASLVELVAAAS